MQAIASSRRRGSGRIFAAMAMALRLSNRRPTLPLHRPAWAIASDESHNLSMASRLAACSATRRDASPASDFASFSRSRFARMSPKVAAPHPSTSAPTTAAAAASAPLFRAASFLTR